MGSSNLLTKQIVDHRGPVGKFGSARVNVLTRELVHSVLQPVVNQIPHSTTRRAMGITGFGRQTQ